MKVITGPNGAGKTTLYETQMAHLGLPFINADVMMKVNPALFAGVPKPDVLAQALADKTREHLVAQKATFITETVFSDPQGAKLDFLKRAQKDGYHVELHCVCIESAADSIARVDARVTNGGHDVPHEKLKARFPRNTQNTMEALKFVDLAILYDNMGCMVPDPDYPDEKPHKIMAIVVRGEVQWVHPQIPDYIRVLLPAKGAKDSATRRNK